MGEQKREPPTTRDGRVRRPEDVRTRPVKEAFATVSRRIADFTGGPWAFALAALVVLAWLVSGPIFGFSDTWQLVINTGTTIVTFLMVFLIQNSQNKDTQVLQLKLDELIASQQGASNRLIGLEHLSEADVERLQLRFLHLAAELEKREETEDRGESTSVEEEGDPTAASRGRRRPKPT